MLLRAPGKRRLRLRGCFNFRDLGGYRTDDGRATRYGRLFRSDSLHGLVSADLDRYGTGLLGVVPEAMSRFLDRAREDHGSFEGYANSAPFRTCGPPCSSRDGTTS